MTQKQALEEACQRLEKVQSLLFAVLQMEQERKRESGKSFKSLLEVLGTSLEEIEDMSAIVDTEDLRAALSST